MTEPVASSRGSKTTINSKTARRALYALLPVAAAVAVPVLLLFLENKEKHLSYEVTSANPIVSSAPEIGSVLQVTLNSEPVSEVWSVGVRISNSGELPISPSDFERAIKLRLGAGTKAWQPHIVDAIPHNLEPSVSLEAESIIVAPLLLNPGDSFTLGLLLSKRPEEVSIDARIAGIENVEKVTHDPLAAAATKPWNVALLVSGLIVYLTLLTSAMADRGGPGWPFQGVALFHPRQLWILTFLAGFAGVGLWAGSRTQHSRLANGVAHGSDCRGARILRG